MCTPASLGLCWGGVLSADWDNGHIKIKSGSEDTVKRISRIETASYPNTSLNPNDNLVCKLLPQSNRNRELAKDTDYLVNSDVVDGVRI